MEPHSFVVLRRCVTAEPDALDVLLNFNLLHRREVAASQTQAIEWPKIYKAIKNTNLIRNIIN